MERQIYSVSKLNNYIKNMVSTDFFLNHVCIRGEVSNFKGAGSSGHLYFTLKDEGSEISVAMWRSKRRGLKGELKNGASVIVTGAVDVYTVRGTYQIIADTIEPTGVGDLYRAFEELKERLSDMGMFAPEYKKPIPEYIRRLGVVTAATGAAIRDIIQITRRRNPYVEIVLSPALVQGEGAAASIVSAIRRLDGAGCDVMIVGRGGGSIEDLWAFNEEPVARAVFDAATPIISAVGHETDTTIVDFVADRRAPTPSAAAELAVFSHEEFMSDIAACRRQLFSKMEYRLGYTRMELERDEQRLLSRSPKERLRRLRAELEHKKSILSNKMEGRLSIYRRQLSVVAERIDARSPAKKLSGGYAYVRDAGGKRLRSIKQVRIGDEILMNVSDGQIKSTVTNTGSV